jgi:hypothetical protein
MTVVLPGSNAPQWLNSLLKNSSSLKKLTSGAEARAFLSDLEARVKLVPFPFCAFLEFFSNL